MAAIGIATFVILFAPAAPTPDAPVDTTVPAPGPTITLDDLEAMLTAEPGQPPPTVQVDTPDGPVTVVLPPPTTAPTPVTTTTAPPPTTTTTTTTTVPLTPRTPASVADDIVDDLRATIPEGAGGEG